MALGVPYEDLSNPVVNNAGAVHFVYGSATGLTAVGDWLHTQPFAGPMAPEADDNLGLSLAASLTVRHKIYLPVVQRRS